MARDLAESARFVLDEKQVPVPGVYSPEQGGIVNEWVYVLVEGNWQDYEGGGDHVLAIYCTESSALRELRNRLVAHELPDLQANEDGCYMLEGSPSSRWLEIQKWALS